MGDMNNMMDMMKMMAQMGPMMEAFNKMMQTTMSQPETETDKQKE